MFASCICLECFVVDLFKSRSRLEAENLFLRHQLNIALRRAPPRLRLCERLFLVLPPRTVRRRSEHVQVVPFAHTETASRELLGRSTRKYLRRNLPSRPCRWPPQQMHIISRSVVGSGVGASTRTICTSHYSWGNGIAPGGGLGIRPRLVWECQQQAPDERVRPAIMTFVNLT